ARVRREDPPRGAGTGPRGPGPEASRVGVRAHDGPGRQRVAPRRAEPLVAAAAPMVGGPVLRSGRSGIQRHRCYMAGCRAGLPHVGRQERLPTPRLRSDCCYLTNTWITTLTVWPPSPYAVSV